MRVGLNMFHFHPPAGGIANYAAILLRHWSGRFPEDPLVLFLYHHNREMLGELPNREDYQLVWLTGQEEIASHLRGLDLFFCPFGALYPRPLPLPSVMTLVDIQERFFPEFFSPSDLATRIYHYDESLAMADAVITISEFSRRSFVEVAGADPSKIHALYLAADELPAPRRPDGFPASMGPFLYYPANNWRHKNHATLFKALRFLRERGSRLPCVLTGVLLEDGCPLPQMARDLGLADQVHHLGRLDRAGVSWLYRNARLMVFPSLFEGFGIPLVEAMESRLPILCSATTSLPEVGGAAARYFDPADPRALAKGIRSLWGDDGERRRMAEAGLSQAARFSPREMIDAHRRVFLAAAGNYRRWSYLMRRLRGRFNLRRRHVLTGKEKKVAARLLAEQRHPAQEVPGYPP